MSDSDKDFELLMKLFTKYLKENNSGKCIDTIRKALRIKPDNSELHWKIGRIYLEEEKREDAMKHFQKILELKENSALAYLGIGLVRFDKKEYPRALKNFKLSLKYEPDNWRIHYYLGRTYEELGKGEEASDHFVKFAKKDCPYPEDNFTIGIKLFEKKKYREAEVCLKKVVKLRKDFPSSYYFLGMIYGRTERWNLAIEHLEKCIKFGFDRPSVRLDLGYAYARKKRFNQAKGQYIKIIEQDSKNPTGYRGLSLLHLEKGKWWSAERSLRKARERGLGDSEWYFTLGSIYLARGAAEKGAACDKKVIEKDPNHYLAHSRLGRFYDERGETGQAIFHFEKTFQLEPADLQTAFLLGLLYLKENRPDECMKCYQRISAIEEKSPRAEMLLAGYHLMQKDFKNAERAAQKAIELNKSLPLSYYLLHMIYSEQNKLDASMECLEKVLKVLKPGQYLGVREYLKLGLVYFSKMMPEKAKLYLEMAAKIDPNSAEAYAFLSVVYLADEYNYELSKSVVKLAEKKPWKILRKENFSFMIACTKKFASAMVNWQDGNLQQAENDFSTWAAIAESNDKADQAKDARFLSCLVSFDRRLQLVSMIENPAVQGQEFAELTLEIMKRVTQEGNEQSKHHTLGLPIAIAKVNLIVVVVNSLMGRDFDRVMKKLLDDAKKLLENVHLTPPPLLFDLIESYAFEQSNARAEFGKTEDAPNDVQIALREKLQRIHKMLGGKMSVEAIGGTGWTILLPDLKKVQTDILSVRMISEDMFKLMKSRPEQFSEQGEIGEPKAPATGILFYKTKVQIVEGKMVRKPVKEYPWRLLELLLQRKRIHWTYGFLIFGKWRSDPGPINPKKTINSYIATLNGRTVDSLAHNKIPVKIEKDGETGEIYLDEYDRSKFFSNIFSAEERVKKVKDILAKGDSEELEDAKKSLADIIDGKEGYYNCYEAYKLLIQHLEKTGFKKEDERVITKVAEFFEEKILVYGESFYAIEVHRKKIPQTYYWKGTDKAVDKMREELRELEQYYKIIAPHAPKKRLSEEFSDIIRLIGEVNSLEPPYEPPLEKKAFKELAHKHSIRSMLNSVSLNILKDERLKNLPVKDIELTILPNFAGAIARARTRHFQSLPPLVKYLKTSTEQRTKEELIEREYEIPANVQRDIRRKGKIQKNLIQKPGHKVRDDEVYKRLGWSKEKQREIRMHESKLWKVSDFNEEQYKDETL